MSIDITHIGSALKRCPSCYRPQISPDVSHHETRRDEVLIETVPSMSSTSSASATTSKLFQKRRRAYIACSNCRKRKVKCITVSDADYRPCTRCSQKGLLCEYIAVTDDPDSLSLNPDTPPEASHGVDEWPQPITPPSAGLNGFLPPHSAPARGGRGASSHPHTPPTSQQSLYRPQTWPATVAPPSGYSSRITQPRPYPPASGMVMGAYEASMNPYNELPNYTPGYAGGLQSGLPTDAWQQPRFASVLLAHLAIVVLILDDENYAQNRAR
ncbi:C6 finger domain [Mycena indigotica]|uniref:C6 finger domain n=1 Tax=Mycena indigotica TaxID=2126181 RepID=A0A8H6WH26_9AGAR|nr:C6 finger domain [Mycena indigotica]KAF7316546.1 C6 finger domain [Mycena indigotica]